MGLGEEQMLFRRIYVSLAAPELDDRNLDDILAASRRNNADAGVTGLLVLYQGRFFQVLEGPRAGVVTCYDRIACDPRHRDMRLIHEAPDHDRAFAQWRMGFSRPDSLRPDLRAAVVSLFDLVPPDSPARGQDDRVRREVRAFLAGMRHLPDRASGP
jgi:hypothetical protein